MGKSLIGKEFDSETAYGDNDRYINSKLKSFGDKVNTRSQDEKNTKKKNASYKCLSLIMLDS